MSGERQYAWERLVSWYTHAAEQARASTRRPVALTATPLDPPPAGVVPPVFDTVSAALAWFDAGRHNLNGVIARLLATRADRQLTDLGSATGVLLRFRSSLTEAVSLQEDVLAATRRTGDRIAEAAILQMLGYSLGMLGRYDTAVGHLTESIRIFRAENDAAGAAIGDGNLGVIYRMMGRVADSLPHQRRVLERCLAAGRLDRAVRTAARALAILERAGDRCPRGMPQKRWRVVVRREVSMSRPGAGSTGPSRSQVR